MKEYQSFLLEQLNERKRKNPQFSLRAFAKNLDMSPSQLSGLIKGRKKLTLKQAAKLIDKFNLDEQSSSDLLREMLPVPLKKNFDSNQRELAEDEFRLVKDWYHFAILSLAKIKTNFATPKWIAEKLQIDPFVAQEAFQRLERLGFVETVDSQYRQSSKPLTTTTDIPSSAIRDHHRQNLHLADMKLDNTPIELRDFSSVTFAANPRKLKKAKKMINDFKQKLCAELEDNEVSEVYTLAIQLFPLTKQENS